VVYCLVEVRQAEIKPHVEQPGEKEGEYEKPHGPQKINGEFEPLLPAAANLDAHENKHDEFYHLDEAREPEDDVFGLLRENYGNSLDSMILDRIR